MLSSEDGNYIVAKVYKQTEDLKFSKPYEHREIKPKIFTFVLPNGVINNECLIWFGNHNCYKMNNQNTSEFNFKSSEEIDTQTGHMYLKHTFWN